MAIRHEVVDGVGPVTLQKRRRTGSVRIHIHGSEVRVTLPHWVSYKQAVDFVKERAPWIAQHRQEITFISHGTYIGKKHQLLIKAGTSTTVRSKIYDDAIHVTLPSGVSVESAEIQQKLHRVAEKALKQQAQVLIAPRLQDLALEHGFKYRSITFKKLKTRWGSCDPDDNIVINIFLAQMPWAQIDYVLLHELAHTMHRNHSAAFWRTVEEVLPDYKQRRKVLKTFQPHLILA